ncbi:hypothetical protein [Albimonas pacifica]|uniref:PEP-CTERM protein-sorting domain-containing protein n=1 Tax=Albimonas pacifica TaxID=1114924 RepID=A0A1I3EMX0_9RHOB|nr:hypothetical protein [Albimonas pacifica]SFI00289.1 PEP-CTERM protein-sorting domain-containing protein [Albimonas pacifica]
MIVRETCASPVLAGALLAAGLALGAAAPAQAIPVAWTDWTALEGPFGDATSRRAVGTAQDAQGDSTGIALTHSSGYLPLLQTGAAGEPDLWGSVGSGGARDLVASPYTSVGPKGVDDIPAGTDIVGINATGAYTFVFDAPVRDIYLSFAILAASLEFGTEYQLLSGARMNLDGQGVDNCSRVASCQPFRLESPTKLSGNNFSAGVVLLEGVFESLTLTLTGPYSTSYFTLGFGGIGDEPPGSPVPVPATLALLPSALSLLGFGAIRRRARRPRA